MRTLLLLLTIFAFSTIVKAQSYIYQYVDPCTKNVKFVSVPLNGANIAVTYYGQVGTFSSADFSNGNFVAWLNQTSGANAGKPCDQATTQAVNSTNLIVTNNIISTLTNITSVSMMSASLASNVASASSTVGGNLGNTVNNGSSGDGSGNGSSSSGNKKNNNRNGNSGGNSNNNSNSSSGSTGNNQSSGSGQGSNSSSAGSTNSQGNGSSTNNGGTSTGSGGNNGSGNTGSGSGSGQGGGSTSSGSGGSGSGSSGSTEGGGSSTQPPVGNTGSTGSTGTGGNGNTNGGGTGSAGGTGNTTESGGLTQSNSSGGNGGTTNSVSNAAEATSSGGSSGGSGGSSKNGDKNRARTGALIGTGDIVAVRSAEEGEKDQFRFTMSMTKSNTKNTFARGFLGNFTTQINNSNITFYGAWTLPKSKTTIIAANSSMINPARDFFNTTTLLASKRFTKLSLMGGLNFTAGAIGETGFQNLSAVGGGFYMFNAGKKITGTLLVLGVYSPFTQFYEGNWWSSGLLVVPFSSWDYSITKKFKFNISFSGTYELNKNMLNYQVLTGGKVML